MILGVVFCTTNNAYEVAHRCGGLRGFEQMFAEKVSVGSLRETSTSVTTYEPNQTTDPQAEVLYPFELSLDHLHTITAGDEETYEAVLWLSGPPSLTVPMSSIPRQIDSRGAS